MKSVLTSLSAMALATACAFPQAALADDGPLVVRARVARIVPADKSDAIPGLGVPKDAIDISDKTIPEIDFSYFFTKNIAAELILTVPQKHTVKLNGTEIGSFKHLPPTLTAQWHFLPGQVFDPYVGAGINVTFISDVKLNVPGVAVLDLDHTSIGGALQVGGDFNIDKKWSINLDVKYVQIRSDVKIKSSETAITKVKLDPFIYGIGVGYRF
jgi:outer membrane protein